MIKKKYFTQKWINDISSVASITYSKKNNVHRYFKKIIIRMKNKIFEVSNTKSRVINEPYILEPRILSVISQVQKNSENICKSINK